MSTKSWTEALTRIDAAVLELVSKDQLGPLGPTIPVDRLAHQLLDELIPCILDSSSGVVEGGRITRMLSVRQPWKLMTIIEYLQTLVGANTSDITQLLAALQIQTTSEQKGYLRMQIESWAANVLDNTPKVNVALERLVSAIRDQRYDDGDEEIIDDDDLRTTEL